MSLDLILFTIYVSVLILLWILCVIFNVIEEEPELVMLTFIWPQVITLSLIAAIVAVPYFLGKGIRIMLMRRGE